MDKFLEYLVRLIKFIVKEILSFFIKSMLFLLLLLIIISAVVAKYNKKSSNVVLKNNSYLLINLAEKYNENLINENPFEEGSINFYTLLNTIETSTYDDKVDGIILKIDGISLSYAQNEELAEELSKFKAENKKIIAYGESIGRKNYYLASYADEIYMPSSNATTVNLYPYFTEKFYIKKLADKFGVKFNIVNVGDYKSYMENLSHDFMSKEAREDSETNLDKNYKKFLDIVSINRKINRDKLDKIIKNGDLVAASSEDLLNNKLIDDRIYWNELEELIGKDKIVSIQDYSNLYYQENTMTSSGNIVYVIPLEGEIVESQTEMLGGMDNIDVSKTLKKLNEAQENEKIKAVVLRINSPGGSALTSDIIAKKVEELASKKPVYVSMSSVAASGGYYISANANKIFVDRNTITGSIGVVSIMPDFSKLITDNGVNIEKISKGEYADLYSADGFTEKKYNKIYNSNLKVYEDFLNVVANGRDMEKEKLKTLAEGRVWTGEEAVKNGLADEIGGLNDTIYSIAEDTNLDEYAVVVAKENFDLGSIYKKYSRFLKMDRKELIKSQVFKDYLYNKPVTYLPYEILD